MESTMTLERISELEVADSITQEEKDEAVYCISEMIWERHHGFVKVDPNAFPNIDISYLVTSLQTILKKPVWHKGLAADFLKKSGVDDLAQKAECDSLASKKLMLVSLAASAMIKFLDKIKFKDMLAALNSMMVFENDVADPLRAHISMFMYTESLK